MCDLAMRLGLATLASVARDKLRLGGMALANGVLVHGPTAWGCAVRLPSGELKVASAPKRFRAAQVGRPLLRGPAKLLEAFAVLPEVKRELPEARLPFERPAVLAAMAASAVAIRVVRGTSRLGPATQELASTLLSVAPAALALRGSELAAYHGAEHVSIGTYEHDEPRPREHERCGTHLLGPLLVATAAANVLVAKAPVALRPTARIGAAIGSLAAATEIFGWMTRHPEHPVSRVLSRPGHEFQSRFATAEPSAGQLEVAQAALDACLALETHG
jgi:uncharacterized protein YqhQ